MLVQNDGDALNFVPVALVRGRDVRRVVFLEPSGLSVVRTLAGHLEVEPLLGFIVLGGKGREAELLLLVVLLDEVFENGTGFRDGDAGVGVMESGETAVGVDLLVIRGLQVGVWDDGGLIRNLKFLQEHVHLPGIGPRTTAVVVERLDLRTHGGNSELYQRRRDY